ncbi:hypothetical protein D3C77_699560 [compost metagenome]
MTINYIYRHIDFAEGIFNAAIIDNIIVTQTLIINFIRIHDFNPCMALSRFSVAFATLYFSLRFIS